MDVNIKCLTPKALKGFCEQSRFFFYSHCSQDFPFSLLLLLLLLDALFNLIRSKAM
jgi:hypothetical protein